MKKAIWLVTIGSFLSLRLFALPPAFATEEEYDEDDYYDSVGLSSSSANFKALSTSMVAWGLGLAAAITILTVVIPQSVDDGSSGGGGGSNGGGGGGSSHSH